MQYKSKKTRQSKLDSTNSLRFERGLTVKYTIPSTLSYKYSKKYLLKDIWLVAPVSSSQVSFHVAFKASFNEILLSTIIKCANSKVLLP